MDESRYRSSGGPGASGGSGRRGNVVLDLDGGETRLVEAAVLGCVGELERDAVLDELADLLEALTLASPRRARVEST